MLLVDSCPAWFTYLDFLLALWGFFSFQFLVLRALYTWPTMTLLSLNTLSISLLRAVFESDHWKVAFRWITETWLCSTFQGQSRVHPLPQATPTKTVSSCESNHTSLPISTTNTVADMCPSYYMGLESEAIFNHCLYNDSVRRLSSHWHRRP